MRPTANRVREAAFNILAHRIAGCRFLDLFAGVGAVGIEALSRGAGYTVFVERDAALVTLLRENLERCGLTDRATVVCADAERYLRRIAGEEVCFDVCYIDPPYAYDAGSVILPTMADHAIMAPGGAVIVEHDRRRRMPEEVKASSPLWLARRYVYGDIVLSLYLSVEPKASNQEDKG